jgi:iron complex outermembrane receptor protein
MKLLYSVSFKITQEKPQPSILSLSYILRISLLIGGALYTSAVSAAENIDSFELSPEQLFSATVMSVSKTSEKLMDAPAAIYVLSNEDIMRSGATSIAEVLRLVPGVQVARTHAGGWAITVRGFANTGLGNKLLVLMDGREVYDQLFSGVYWDVQDTALEDIERIEVIRGPGASLWGANAVNGVINIITKNAKDTQGTLVSAIAGNQDRAIATGRYGGKAGENIYYRAYAKYLNRDEERLENGLGANDPQQAYRTGFRSDWKGSDNKDSFTVQGDMVRNDDSQYRISPDLLLATEHIHATGWNLLGRWQRELPEDSRLSIQSYIDYTYRDQLLIADQRTNYDLDMQYELPSYGRHKMIIGGKYRLSSDRIGESAFITSTNISRNDQLFSGFLQDKITLSPQWFLTLGSKFEHNDYSGFEAQPSARLQWHIDDDKMAWASVARAVRTPSQLEQDFTIKFLEAFGVTFFGLIPNPDFSSEELTAYEMGYRQKLSSSLTLDVSGFYNDYDKLASVVMLPSGPFISNIQYNNNSKAESYGGEVVLDWRASNKLKFSTSYSLLDLQVHGPANGIDAEVAEGQSPQQQFNIRSQWNILSNLSLDNMLYYVDSLPDFHVKNYWRLDANLGWKINDNMQFNLVGQNLLSGTHTEFAPGSFTPTARIEPSVYGKITWKY